MMYKRWNLWYFIEISQRFNLIRNTSLKKKSAWKFLMKFKVVEKECPIKAQSEKSGKLWFYWQILAFLAFFSHTLYCIRIMLSFQCHHIQCSLCHKIRYPPIYFRDNRTKALRMYMEQNTASFQNLPPSGYQIIEGWNKQNNVVLIHTRAIRWIFLTYLFGKSQPWYYCKRHSCKEQRVIVG